MTAQEWRDEISDLWDLMSWCGEHGVCGNLVENIIDSDSFDQYVEDDINDRYCGWMDLRDYLNDLPSGYDYYRYNGSFDYDGLTRSDYEEIREDVFDHLVDIGWFSDESEEESEMEDDISQYESCDPEDDTEYEMDDFDMDILNGYLSDAHGILNAQPEPEAEPLFPDLDVEEVVEEAVEEAEEEEYDEAFDEAVLNALLSLREPVGSVSVG